MSNDTRGHARLYGTLLALLLPFLGVGPAFAQEIPKQSNSGGIASAWKRNAYGFETRHYRVRTDLPRDEAERVARHMDISADACACAFSSLTAHRTLRFEALLFADAASYVAVLATDLNADGRGSAGMAMKRGGRSILAVHGRSLGAMKTTIQHEVLHQFAAIFIPDAPPWLNEGLAEIFELGVLYDGRLILGEVPAARLRGLQASARQNALVPLRTFLDIDGGDWGEFLHRREAGGNYMQAWLLVHFLIFGNDGAHRGAFNALLVEMSRGQGWRGAVQRSLRVNPAQPTALEAAFLEYIYAAPATDYRTLMRRLDFLAAGLGALHERGLAPESIDDLAAQLTEIDFTHPNTLFGGSGTLKATTAVLYTVPGTSGATPAPAFVLEPAPTRAERAAQRVRQKIEKAKRRRAADDTDDADEAPAEERPPLPLFIRVDRAWPASWMVTWSLDPATGAAVPFLDVRW